ncbi:MAG: hypothetical protein ABIH72_00455 [archaeon]
MDIKGVLDSLQGIQGVDLRILPDDYHLIITIAIYTILIAIYAIFVYKFYRFLGRRDILKLDLNQYNKTDHPGWNKFFASVFFILEYIIVLPIIVIFWFLFLAIFLLLLSEDQTIAQVLLVAGGIVASIRLTSYFSEDLSKDLAKIFPFTVLAIFLLNPDFFLLSNLVSKAAEIPMLLRNIYIYVIFIVSLEAALRIVFIFVDAMVDSELSSGKDGK